MSRSHSHLRMANCQCVWLIANLRFGRAEINGSLKPAPISCGKSRIVRHAPQAPECGAMRQTQNKVESYRDWRMVVLAGVLGFAITLAVMEIIDAYLLSLTSLSIALAAVTGSLSGICLVGSFSAWRVRQKLSEQNMRLDGALNNMIQGLCMFDAQNRLLVWNERYRAMYNIDPLRIWRGCTIRDLLDARTAAAPDAQRIDVVHGPVALVPDQQ